MLPNKNSFSNELKTNSKSSVLDYFVSDSIINGDISFAYQPVIDVTNKKIAFLESLMRFNFDANMGGSVEKLFEVLEDKKFLISERKLRDYSLNKICNDLKLLKNHGFDSKFSLNVSAKLFDENFCIDVASTLDKYGLLISDLIIEITENRNSSKKYFENKKEENNFVGILTQAKNYGFKFAADDYDENDFRSNFLSMFNIVKTNKDFCHNSFGKNKSSEKEFAVNPENIYVIERIENHTDLELLKSLNFSGSKLIQGFYASKPLSLLQVINMYNNLSVSLDWDDYKRKINFRPYVETLDNNRLKKAPNNVFSHHNALKSFEADYIAKYVTQSVFKRQKS